MNAILPRCEQCGGPCPDDLPYCSFKCHRRAEGRDPDETVTLTEEPPVPLCTICHHNTVNAEDGFDTCHDCMARV
jgi:hypothetical protein